MKKIGLMVLFGLAAAVAGCGKIQSVFRFCPFGPAKNPQMQAFSGLGDVVQTSPKGLQITLDADEIFRKNSDRLSQTGLEKVDAIAAAVLKYQGDHIAVGEFMDSAANIKIARLSRRLADVVKKELIKRGIGAAFVTAAGNSSSAAGGNSMDKNRERRIIFEVTAS